MTLRKVQYLTKIMSSGSNGRKRRRHLVRKTLLQFSFSPLLLPFALLKNLRITILFFELDGFFGHFLPLLFRLRRLPISVVVLISMQTRSLSFNCESHAIKLPCSSGYDTCIVSIRFRRTEVFNPPHCYFRQQSSNSVMEYHTENISGRWFIDGVWGILSSNGYFSCAHPNSPFSLKVVVTKENG